MEYGVQRAYQDSDQGMFRCRDEGRVDQPGRHLHRVFASGERRTCREASVGHPNTWTPRSVRTSHPIQPRGSACRCHTPVSDDHKTIVECGIRTFPAGDESEQHTEWLESTIGDLQDQLGLVFHQLIVQGLTIGVDVYDELAGRAGAPRTVRAVDPFRAQAVRRCRVPAAGGAVAAWYADDRPPHRPRLRSRCRSSRSVVFRANPRSIFVYRNDRLLQPGGWLDVGKAWSREWGWRESLSTSAPNCARM